jgi:hypothetical protein
MGQIETKPVNFKDIIQQSKVQQSQQTQHPQSIEEQQIQQMQQMQQNTELIIKAENFINDAFDARCACSGPQVAFWLSKKKRDECNQATHKATRSFRDLCVYGTPYEVLLSEHDKVGGFVDTKQTE